MAERALQYQSIAAVPAQVFAVPVFVSGGVIIRPLSVTQYQAKASPVQFTQETPTFFGVPSVDLLPLQSVVQPGFFADGRPPTVAEATFFGGQQPDIVRLAEMVQSDWFASAPFYSATPTGWAGTYPDWFARALITPESVPTAPFTATLTETPHIGLALYPDTIAAELFSASAQQAWATGSGTPPPPLAWQPDFADAVRRAALSPDTQTYGPIQYAQLPPLTWEGVYPDQTAALRLPTGAAQAFAGSTSSAFPVPHLSWSSEYADRVPGARPLTDWQTFAFYPTPFAVPINQFAWRGQYPAWLPVVRPVEYPAFTTGLTASSMPLPRPLVWLGKYPERAPGPRPLVDWTTFAQNVFPIAVPVNQFGWRGVYADFARAQRLAMESMQWQTFSLPPDFTVRTPLSWQPRYIDVVRARVLAAWQTLAFDAFPRPSVATLISVTTPDQFALPRLVSGPVFSTSYVQASVPLLLAWESVYPDAPLRAAATPQSAAATPLDTPGVRFTATATFTDFFPRRVTPPSEAVKPASQAPAPLGVVLASYPDAVVRDKMPAAQQRAWASSTSSAFPVPHHSWHGTWPDFARSKTLPAADMPFRDERGRLFVPAVITGWTPTYADTARGPQPINVGPALAFTRLTLLFGPEVMHFTLELALQPTLVDQAAYQPMFTLEAMAQPAVEHIQAFDENASQPFVVNEFAAQPTMTDENEDT